jgi:hypothetical protein
VRQRDEGRRAVAVDEFVADIRIALAEGGGT